MYRWCCFVDQQFKVFNFAQASDFLRQQRIHDPTITFSPFSFKPGNPAVLLQPPQRTQLLQSPELSATNESTSSPSPPPSPALTPSSTSSPPLQIPKIPRLGTILLLYVHNTWKTLAPAIVVPLGAALQEGGPAVHKLHRRKKNKLSPLGTSNQLVAVRWITGHARAAYFDVIDWHRQHSTIHEHKRPVCWRALQTGGGSLIRFERACHLIAPHAVTSHRKQRQDVHGTSKLVTNEPE